MDKKYFKCFFLILTLVVFAGLLFVSKASAAVTLTPATGGTDISIDTTSYSGGTSASTTLIGPIIAEQALGDIASSTQHVLTLPAGWIFNTAPGQVHLIVTGTLTLGATTTTDNTITFWVTATSTVGTLSTITFSGIQVMPTGISTSTVNITQTAGTITGITNSVTSLGAINSVVGAVASLNIYRAPVVHATVDAAFDTQPIISVIDRFGHGVGSESVVASLGSGTGTLSGTLTKTSNSIGSTTFTDLLYQKSGEAFTVKFTDGAVSTTSASLGPLAVGAAAALSVETAADGSGTTVAAQGLNSGSTLTVYSITKDQYTNFVANAAADAWSLTSKTSNIADSDLAAAADSKSAVMTGHDVGTAKIHATNGALTADSGTITVAACSPYTVSNGSVGSYPTCTITCNAGYYLTGTTCSMVDSGGIFGGGGGGYISPSSPTYSSGSLLRASNSDKVYLIDNGEKRWIPTGEIFNANGYSWANVKVVDPSVISGYTEGTNVQQVTTPPTSQTIPEGGLIRANGDVDVYIVKYVGSKKFKRLILSPSVFNSYKHLKWSDIKDVDKSVVDSFTTSDLVRAVGDPKVYKLYPAGDTGEKRWIETAAAFTSLGYDWDSVYEINQTDRDSYKTGQALK